MEASKTTLSVCMLAVVMVWSLPSALGQVSFQGLGDLSGGDFFSEANAVSADGSVVVGWSHSAQGSRAFRWENGMMTGLATLAGGSWSVAHAISADGSVIVGGSGSDSGQEAFRWVGGVMTGLGDLPGGDFGSRAYGVSADGTVVVGESLSGPGTQANEAFRWTAPDGMLSLGDLPGGISRSWANGASANGSVIVGWGVPESHHEEAFRWESGVMTGLGHLDVGDSKYSEATAVSGDGSVIVGWSNGDFAMEAFRWENGVMTGLGGLAGGEFEESMALAVSADGSIVVGQSESASGPTAFIWDERHGMRSLKQVLQNQGLDLTGWTLNFATGVSGDGLTIVGAGSSPNGWEGWIATLPEPTTLSLLTLGGLALLRRRR